MKKSLRAFGYFRPEAGLLALVLGLIAAGAVAGLLKPWPLSLLVDCVFGTSAVPGWLAGLPGGGENAALIKWLAVLVLVLHLVQGGISALYTYLSIQIGLRGLNRVRNELFEKLMRLSLRFYHGAQMGDVIYRASWDTYAFQTCFQQGWITLGTSLISLLMMLVVMARLNARLTLVALGVVPLLLLAIRHFGRQMTQLSGAAQRADSLVTSTVQQDIAALQIIQSYTREARETDRYRARSAAARTSRFAQHRAEVLYALAIASIFATGTAGIAWTGAGEVLRGHLTLGELLVFVAYLAQIYEPLNQLSHVGATLSAAGAGMSRVFELPERV